MLSAWSVLADSWAGLDDVWFRTGTRVELGLNKAFTLDDPIQGVIGSDFTIGGLQFVDVTSRVRSVSISRGKNRDLDRFNAGGLTVTFNNQDRTFDPLYSASPFAGNIVPRRNVQVSTDGALQYVGKVTDWNLGYDVSGQSIAELQAADGLTFLAQQVLTAGTATVQSSGDRVEAVLSMPSVDWPLGERNIDTGASTLGADVFEGNALTYLQKVELSEGGLFFIDKAGRVAFRDRLATPTVDNVTVFADDGTGIPFAPAAVEYGTEQLFNQVIVTSPGATATANAALSQTRYGILERQIDTLLDDTDQVADYADFLVGRYAEPEYRFAELSVNISNLTTGQKASMYSLDMGSVIQVKFTPNNIGSPIVRYGLVISIGHDISPDDHIMTIGVGSLQTSLFVIGDPVFGTIGEGAPGVLGF
jgi:hypothetical protein